MAVSNWSYGPLPALNFPVEEWEAPVEEREDETSVPQGGFSATSWRTDFFVFNPIGRAIAWPANFVAPFWQYDGQQVNPISGEVLSIQTQQDVAVLSIAIGPAGALRGLAAKTLPALPEALTLGRNAETGISVYQGILNGRAVYCGITCNLGQRAAQHSSRFDELDAITRMSTVTRGEGRAIEEALILRDRGQNIRHSISPDHPWHQQAVDWGEAWLLRNGY
jgi:hypothetical protein